jgi:hypothetical protein
MQCIRCFVIIIMPDSSAVLVAAVPTHVHFAVQAIPGVGQIAGPGSCLHHVSSSCQRKLRACNLQGPCTSLVQVTSGDQVKLASVQKGVCKQVKQIHFPLLPPPVAGPQVVTKTWGGAPGWWHLRLTQSWYLKWQQPRHRTYNTC